MKTTRPQKKSHRQVGASKGEKLQTSKISTCQLCQKIINLSRCAGTIQPVRRGKKQYISWSEYSNSAKTCQNCQVIKARLESMNSPKESPRAKHSQSCRIRICHEIAGIEIHLVGRCCSSHQNYLELKCPHEECGKDYFVPVNGRIDPRTILRWISTCDQDHECAGESGVTEMRRVSKNPNMLLVDLERFCLVQAKESVRYTCLSYVWGQTGSSLRTTKENVEELSKPGALLRQAADIPRTISDAMVVTKSLGIRFIWVDRLCIIQDDKEAMRQQIQWMASIYACSYFTIVAASGSDDQYGLPGVVHKRNLRRSVLCLNNSWEFAVNDRSWDEKDDTYSSRAWTFQERLLPSRCLVFYQGTVKWECREQTSFELLGQSPRFKGWEQHIFGPRMKVDPVEFAHLAQKYSGRNLTLEGDAMNAFTAILDYLAPSFPGGFLFGLPERAFHNALRWEQWVFPKLVRRRDFPSWSWLGWKGESMIPLEGGGCIADEEYWKNSAKYCKPQIPLVEWFKQEKDTDIRVPVRNFRDRWEAFQPELDGKFHVESSLVVSPTEFDDLRMWSPCLHGRVQIGELKMGKLLWDHHPRFHLLDMNDKWCGTAEPTDSERPMYVFGDVCEILPISRGQYTVEGLRVVLRWEYDEVWDNLKSFLGNSDDETAWHCIVDAIWIRWEDGVAYRQGLCHIRGATWDSMLKREIDIVLG